MPTVDLSQGVLETGTDSPVIANEMTLHEIWGRILTSKHTLINDTIASEQKTVAGVQGETRISHFVDVSRNQITRRHVAPESVPQDADVTDETRNFTQPVHRRLGFNQGVDDTECRDDKDAGCIVVILIHRPEYQTRNLEYVERVECLGS